MDFNDKDLFVHVQHVNSRREHHGEDEVLAVDVALRLMMGETGDEWGKVLVDVFGEFAESLPDLTQLCKKIVLDAEFTFHKATFRFAPDTAALVVLPSCSINKFVIDCDDLGVTFRIQVSRVDGATIGKLAELTGMRQRLEVESIQGVLEFSPPASGDAVTEGAPA